MSRLLEPIRDALHRAMLLHTAADGLRLQLDYVARTLGKPGGGATTGAGIPTFFEHLHGTVHAIETAVLDDAGLDRNPVVYDDTVADDGDGDEPGAHTPTMPDWCALLDGRAADVRARLVQALAMVDEVIERVADVAETGVINPD